MQDKEYVVGWIDWWDHALILERIFGSSWREAVFAHSKNCFAQLEDISEDIEEAKCSAFDMDSMFSVIEI